MLHRIIKVTPSFLYLFSVSTEIPSFLEGVFSTKSSFDQYQSAIFVGKSGFHSNFNFVNLKAPKLEVIEEEVSLDATANAVLGQGDDQNCTYPNTRNSILFFSLKLSEP